MQRMIRCPPDNPDVPNPFAKIEPYRYSQKMFKTFSIEEIGQQAGLESLLQTNEPAEKDRGVGKHCDIGQPTFQVR